MTDVSLMGAAPSAGSAATLRAVVHLYPSSDGEVVALRGVDLDIRAGSSVALLGPSGAGKSTVLALLAGRFVASAGQVLVGGEDVSRMGAARLARLRALDVALVVQGAGRNLLPYATVGDNVWFAQRGAAARRGPPALDPEQLLHIFDATDLADQVCGALSPGVQQLAGVAPLPGLLLLDELTSRLEPSARDRVLSAVSTITARFGTTVVLVTHDPVVAESAARAVTIRDGRIGAEGLGGSEYAVVAPDGSLQLPADALGVLPPGSLVRVARCEDHIELRKQ